MSSLFCLGSCKNLSKLAWHVGNMVELPNQSQLNVVTDLLGHPARYICILSNWRQCNHGFYLRRGARVAMACRDMERARAAAEDVKKQVRKTCRALKKNVGNLWVFVQLIHRPTRPKISCTKTQTLPNLRLPMSSDDDDESNEPFFLRRSRDTIRKCQRT